VNLSIEAVRGLPEVREGDDLAALIAGAADLRDGDVVVVAQKVVSKAEGAVVDVPPGEDRAAARARVAREQAVRVLVEAPWTIVVETPQGLVCANAGVDASNVEPGRLTLLPADPDASARRLREGLRARAGADVAVVVSDTFGRPWRLGLTDVAIGLAGFAPIRDDRGRRDRFGVVLEITEVAVADEVAAAADLVRGKADGVPVVVVRGLAWAPDEQAGAADLVRPAATDLFPRGRGAVADALAMPPPLREGGRTPADDDWARTLAAVRTAGGARVHTERQGAALHLAPRGADAPDLVALGAAAATARAALADLGWASRIDSGPGGRLTLWTAEPAS
jgi:coenzyme F420-0:L-glutamate ligase/coenzyme F420-1:gamma-L-glutamate ligase